MKKNTDISRKNLIFDRSYVALFEKLATRWRFVQSHNTGTLVIFTLSLMCCVYERSPTSLSSWSVKRICREWLRCHAFFCRHLFPMAFLSPLCPFFPLRNNKNINIVCLIFAGCLKIQKSGVYREWWVYRMIRKCCSTLYGASKKYMGQSFCFCFLLIFWMSHKIWP